MFLCYTVNNPLLLSAQSVLISRFLINLRRASQYTDTTASGESSRFSVLNFDRPTFSTILGDMGQPLDYEENGIGDDEGEAHNLEVAMQRAAREGSRDNFKEVRRRRISCPSLVASSRSFCCEAFSNDSRLVATRVH